MEAEVVMYEAQKKKLQGLCDEHDLVFKLEKNEYPISLTVSMAQAQYEQVPLIEGQQEEPDCDPSARCVWVFKDGALSMKVEGGAFTIDKALRGKIENIFMKLISFWQQFFFRNVIEKGGLRKGAMPAIPEDIADGEPVESFEE